MVHFRVITTNLSSISLRHFFVDD
jgi:hypothetical protein